MKRLASLVLSVTACSGGSHAASVGNTTAAHPTQSAPTVAWTPRTDADFGTFQITGLPALTADAADVVYAYQAEDGARGEPNLTLVTKDRADKNVDELAVMTLRDDSGADAPTQAQLDQANHYLADGN